MTTLYRIHCGLDTNGHDEVNAEALIRNLAAEAFPHGHTILEAEGRWQCADGEAVSEKTIIVEWMTQHNDREAQLRVARLAAAYKHGAFQEAVMVTTQEIDAIFI